MHPVSHKMMSAAIRYHVTLTAGMTLAGSRALSDGPTAGELLLEAGFGSGLRPSLSDLYRLPIVEGLGEMMAQSREEIARTTLRFYRERPDVVDAARDRLRPYLRRGFNLGGQMGLDALELDGWFELTDDHIGDVLEAHAGRLVETRWQAEMSLLVTTAEEIGREVSRRRDDGVSAADMLPLLSAWVLGRTVIRSAIIAETETVRMTRWGMLWAFAGNGIRGVVHECAPDVEQRCNGACPPLCGTEYELSSVFNPMGGIPAEGQIPLHPRCRCWYVPLHDGWVKPALIWTGFALSALD